MISGSSELMQLLKPEFGVMKIYRLQGDASQRIYYRCRNGEYDLAVQVYPDNKEKFNAQLQSHAFLSKKGVPVAPILESYGDEGVIAFEFLQGRSLLELLSSGIPLKEFKEELNGILDKLSLIPYKEYNSRFPPMDRDHYLWGFKFFLNEFINREMGIKVMPEIKNSLLLEFEDIAALLDSGPLSLVHRDFHSGNIILHNGRLFLIDYQDLREGNAFYDRASLLWDAYYDHGKGRESFYLPLDRYQHQLESLAIQRSFKILGNFAYLKNSFDKPAYLKNYGSRVISYLKELLSDTGYRALKNILNTVKDG